MSYKFYICKKRHILKSTYFKLNASAWQTDDLSDMLSNLMKQPHRAGTATDALLYHFTNLSNFSFFDAGNIISQTEDVYKSTQQNYPSIDAARLKILMPIFMQLHSKSFVRLTNYYILNQQLIPDFQVENLKASVNWFIRRLHTMDAQVFVAYADYLITNKKLLPLDIRAELAEQWSWMPKDDQFSLCSEKVHDAFDKALKALTVVRRTACSPALK